jgi:hypothetical protein
MALKKTGVSLGLAVLVAIGSIALLLNLQHTPCEQRAPLTVVATIAAFVIALCVRQFAQPMSTASRNLVLAALLIAAACLFADARFVIEYRGICNAPIIDSPQQ